MYPARHTGKRWCALLCAVPANFMSGVFCTYILMVEESFRLSQSVAYPAGIVFAVVCAAVYGYKLAKGKTGTLS